jgi:hypothetical protein
MRFITFIILIFVSLSAWCYDTADVKRIHLATLDYVQQKPGRYTDLQTLAVFIKMLPAEIKRDLMILKAQNTFGTVTYIVTFISLDDYLCFSIPFYVPSTLEILSEEEYAAIKWRGDGRTY